MLGNLCQFIVIRSPGRALVNVLSINKEGGRDDLPSFDTANIPLDLKGQRIKGVADITKKRRWNQDEESC